MTEDDRRSVRDRDPHEFLFRAPIDPTEPLMAVRIIHAVEWVEANREVYKQLLAERADRKDWRRAALIVVGLATTVGPFLWAVLNYAPMILAAIQQVKP